jgi:hypothetical protein
MKKQIGFGMICFVSLMIAAICFAGCFSSTSPVGTGMSSMPLIGHDEFEIQYYNEEMKIEEMMVVVDIYGDKALVLDKSMQYLPVGGEGIASLDMNNKIWFSFGLKNTGSAPITITGATINGQEFNYADQSMNKLGPKTINPGRVQKVSWTYPGEVSGKSIHFTIEIKTSGGGETAKAQTGQTRTVKPTATQTSAGSVQTTSAVGPTPTQVNEDYYRLLREGKFKDLPAYYKPDWGPREFAILQEQSNALRSGEYSVEMLGGPVYETDTQAYIPARFTYQGQVREEQIIFYKVDGVWLRSDMDSTDS